MAVDLNAKRLRLLFLLPFPPRVRGRHGGATVSGQLLAALARRHAVAALYLAEPGEAEPDAELMAACERVEPVERGARTGFAARVVGKLALARGTPTWAHELVEPRFAARVRELARDWRPDVVQLEYPVMGQYLAELSSCPAPRVLGIHDAAMRDLRRWHGAAGRATRLLDDRAWRRFGRRVVDAADTAVVFTESDRGTVEALGTSTPVAVIPFSTRIPAAALDPAGSPPPTVLFFGNFTHPPNVDAARWLATEIFPPLRQRDRSARLVIAGAEAGADVRALAGPGIEVSGELPDLDAALDRAAVVAAPLREGAGMRVKVVEAIAAGKAVVATPLAVRGLDVASGDQLEIASDADGFRRALGRLLADERERRRLATRAREWAVEHLEWDASIGRYEELYDALLGAEG